MQFDIGVETAERIAKYIVPMNLLSISTINSGLLYSLQFRLVFAIIIINWLSLALPMNYRYLNRKCIKIRLYLKYLYNYYYIVFVKLNYIIFAISTSSILI